MKPPRSNWSLGPVQGPSAEAVVFMLGKSFFKPSSCTPRLEEPLSRIPRQPAEQLVDNNVAHTNGVDLDLPETLLRPRDREPPEWCCQSRMVVAAKDDLAASRAHQHAEVRQQLVGAVHEAFVKAAQGTSRQPLKSKAQDAVMGHTSEGLIIQARGRQHSQVCARLRAARTLAQAHVITYQHTFGIAMTKVGLGEPHRHDRAVHEALREPRPLLTARPAAVLEAGWAAARPVSHQDVPGGRVEEHSQGLRRMADGNVTHVEAVPGVTGMIWKLPSVHFLQLHHEWASKRRGRRGYRRTFTAGLATQNSPDITCRLLQCQQGDCRKESPQGLRHTWLSFVKPGRPR
eukprot:CAMPEP_0179188948 /NCGR_PEP_ID=MMETSP0796-20121207/93789_1 /TAXON_ID=73915 /ORGANISM="Pyrodinium bahamense, Strain pbaha01" /LENGTH=344 /DNA_ID=CAMNT_0020893067 /DNA_START=399 /DNA_END=1433 /DNA_ORIENTATION=+